MAAPALQEPAVPGFMRQCARVPRSLYRLARHRSYVARVRRQYPRLPRVLERHFRGTEDREVQEVLRFVRTCGAQMLPYAWVEEYRAADFDVATDASGLLRVNVRSAPVFFPSSFTSEEVARAVANALAEQDFRSPHAYWCKRFSRNDDDIAVLVGASDGIYALQLVDHVSHLYLFEADATWFNALARTLRPWKDKVTLVEGIVGERTGGGTVSLDAFFEAEGVLPTYIQADVEGAEAAVIAGARGILSRAGRISLSICCYHRQDDEATLRESLGGVGLDVHTTAGYMLLWPQLLSPPYLRRGVIHAHKGQ